MQELAVMLIVVGAVGFAGWRLLPLAFWQRLGFAPKRCGTPATVQAAGPHPGCAGCPAGSDCAKRR